MFKKPTEVRGVAKIAGRSYAMSEQSGLAIVEIDGNLTLVKFSCPLESIPPQGSGTIISQTFNLRVVGGLLTYEGSKVEYGSLEKA